MLANNHCRILSALLTLPSLPFPLHDVSSDFHFEWVRSHSTYALFPLPFPFPFAKGEPTKFSITVPKSEPEPEPEFATGRGAAMTAEMANTAKKVLACILCDVVSVYETALGVMEEDGEVVEDAGNLESI